MNNLVTTSSTNRDIYDVVIIGAGLSGLMCARTLQQQGHQVIILDKSRGVGGRVATRRVENIPIDHGLPYWDIQGSNTENLVKQLQQDQILQLWQGKFYELDANQNLQVAPAKKRYVANSGINGIAKSLANGLNIDKQCRVIKIKTNQNQTWEIIYDFKSNSSRIYAKKLVIAIPAPQTTAILTEVQEQLPPEFLTQLQSVTFDPCLAVMAEYDSKYLAQLPLWQGVTLTNHPNLAWIALDSSKRTHQTKPIFVLHSTAQFAQNHLETGDLMPIGQTLLTTSASTLLSWLDSPQNFQVHRWRYAIPNHYLSLPYLATHTPLPLICCGDWCQGNNIESALNSGLLAAKLIISNL